MERREKREERRERRVYVARKQLEVF